MSIQTIQELSGHSGCRVMLCQDDDSTFIRKKSSTKPYNERLKKQWIKQKHFGRGALKTPAVLGSGYENGLFYFDMEYISAQNMADYIDAAELDDILSFLDLLFRNLPVEKTGRNQHAASVFSGKLHALAQTVPTDEEVVFEAIKRLYDFDFSTVPRTWCCGDLTLENILITENKNIYLIDFLDSFYSSWMIDVAKLFQDLEFRWSYRDRPKNIHRELKLLIAKEILIKKVVDLDRDVKTLFTIYHLVLLNTLRIIPYAKDAATRRYLHQTLADIMRRIDEIKEYL